VHGIADIISRAGLKQVRDPATPGSPCHFSNWQRLINQLFRSSRAQRPMRWLVIAVFGTPTLLNVGVIRHSDALGCDSSPTGLERIA
jgi:hypothetical protein